jgi:hypothetical protein
MRVQLRIQNLLMEEKPITDTSEAYVWLALWKMKYKLTRTGNWCVVIERLGKRLSNEELDRKDFDAAFGKGANKVLHPVERAKIGKYREKKKTQQVQCSKD